MLPFLLAVLCTAWRVLKHQLPGALHDAVRLGDVDVRAEVLAHRGLEPDLAQRHPVVAHLPDLFVVEPLVRVCAASSINQ